LATSREQAMTDSFRRWNRVLLIVFGVLTIAFLIGPSLLIVPMGFSSAKILSFPPPGFSLQWYEKMVTSPSWTAGFINSFQVAILTAILSSILGTMAALGISRGRFPGKSVANVLILSPLVVPVVVIAIGMFSLYVRWKITGSVVGLVVAHTALAVPFVVVSVTTFRHITLPLIMPGVFAGALFAFLSSWDEVVVAIFLTTTKFRTLPTVMWEQVRQVIDPTVASVATVLLAVTTIVLTLALVVRRQAPVR
jgi:putative spermidine/putrescine transport system permease protein